MSLEYFVNDKYKVLSCMAERQISVNGSQVIKLSQQEIADILQISKVKVNGLISELKADGYLVQLTTRGKYALTAKATTELADFQMRRPIQ